MHKPAPNPAEKLDTLSEWLLADISLDNQMNLVVGDTRIRINSNSAALIVYLENYFRHCPTTTEEPDIVVTALERTPPALSLNFQDWKRDAGKVGRKDAFAEVPGGRVVCKVRTGMQFLMGKDTRLAVGHCLDNANQVVNFVISQYISWLLRQEWLLCHAAGVTRDGRGLALVGTSGGGKSTLALHLMNRGLDFVSNDRLLVRHGDGQTRMAGVPKLPRINPGTILNNPNLAAILPAGRARELSRLDPEALWGLEEKYDVDIETVYGPGRIAPTARLDAFVILNWRLSVADAPRMRRVELAERGDLLAAIMKPAGPFHETTDGWSVQTAEDLSPEPYLRHLAETPVYEIHGGVDFDWAAGECLALHNAGSKPG